MKRLTVNWNAELGRPGINYSIIALEGSTCGDYCEEYCYDHGNCNECEVQKAIRKLAAYEDTGLEPDEVARLKELHGGGCVD